MRRMEHYFGEFCVSGAGAPGAERKESEFHDQSRKV